VGDDSRANPWWCEWVEKEEGFTPLEEEDEGLCWSIDKCLFYL